MTDLPDRILLPKFTPEKLAQVKDSALSDLLSVGPDKPMGNLPIATIKYNGFTVEEVAERLKAKESVVVKLFPASEHGGKEALVAYDRNSLQKLLDTGNNSQILRDSNWPTDPDAFVRKVETEIAPNKPLDDLVAAAFADRTRTERQCKGIDTGKILSFVERSAAGIPLYLPGELNTEEAHAMASRMGMKDLIAVCTPHIKFQRTRKGWGHAQFSLRSDGTPFDIHPLLKRTVDYDPATAKTLLSEANVGLSTRGHGLLHRIRAGFRSH